jgi:hypothetical protein
LEDFIEISNQQDAIFPTLKVLVDLGKSISILAARIIYKAWAKIR